MDAEGVGDVSTPREVDGVVVVLMVPGAEGEELPPVALNKLLNEAMELRLCVSAEEGEVLWLCDIVPLALGQRVAVPLKEADVEPEAHPEPVPLARAEMLALAL